MIPTAALPVAAVIISALAGAASTVVYHRIAPRPRPGDLHRYFTRGRHRRRGEATAQPALPAEDAETVRLFHRLNVARRQDAAMATYPEAGEVGLFDRILEEGRTDG